MNSVVKKCTPIHAECPVRDKMLVEKKMKPQSHRLSRRDKILLKYPFSTIVAYLTARSVAFLHSFSTNIKSLRDYNAIFNYSLK